MRARDDQKQEVQQATDIVRLIGEQIALRPRGKEFVGLCPFHDDKSPSMYVSPAKQIYKCFSCGAGGSVFDFVMNYHKMGFREALEHLADRAGIKLQRWERDGDGAQTDGPSERELIAAANAKALSFFRGLYKHADHGRVARDYVDQRGIHPDMVELFQIGYAPDRWDGLVQMIAGKGWNRRGFHLAGLTKTRETGGEYDALRHRLIFPILDALGRPIAFGGRKLRPEDEPKYLNSPETRLFNKSATLFGLHAAKKAIIDSRIAVIVEGYTDVIACHQAGLGNVVATLGTALTTQHASELRRYCDRVVLVFDADDAGRKAADRAVEVFLTSEIDVAIAVLPSPTGEKVDPAELLAEEDGPARWHEAMAAARDALDYQFDRVREELSAQSTLSGRQRVAESYVQKLAGLGVGRAGVLRAAMVRTRLASLLHVSEAEVAQLLARHAPRRSGPTVVREVPEHVATTSTNQVLADVAAGASAARVTALRRAELELIGCLLHANELFHAALPDGGTIDEMLTPDQMITEHGQRLYTWLSGRMCDGQAVSVATLSADLAEAGEPELVAMATDADRVVESMGFDSEGLRSHGVAVAEALTRAADERRRRQQRADLLDQVRGGAVVDEQAVRLLIEQARAGASPVRIARMSG